MKRLFLFALSALLAVPALAEIRLPAIIGNDMVLQQQADVLLWGWCDPDTKVSIAPSWSKTVYTALSDGTGRWEATVPTVGAGGPYEIRIRAGKEQRLLTNVLLGEVWLCGGQSNMDISFRGLRNQPILHAADEILDSNYPELRLFRVARGYSFEPQEDCKGSWRVSSPESAETQSAVGFLFGRLLHQREKVPVGIITCAWGGSRVEAWMSRENVLRFKGVKIPETVEPNRVNVTPTMLFNGMIRPIAGFRIRGCLFYQGEANCTNPAAYRERFPEMVKEWRSLWGYEFPFFYVQLAPFTYDNMGDRFDKRQVAYFREVQHECQRLIPSSAMAATSDIGARHTIHPADKQTLAKRLYYLAAAKVYGRRGFQCQGPEYKEMEIHNDTIALRFKNTPYGISSNGRRIVGFEIAGEDRVFHPAEAWVKNGATVWVRSGEVKNPVAVRYCFSNYHEPANLYNNYGLVAYPFRTDDWAQEKNR